MAPEDEFVLAISRTQATPASLTRARELAANGLNWRGVYDRIRIGQVGPLAYHGLGQLGGGVGPDALHQVLRSQYAANWERSRHFRRFLGPIVASLDDAGIPVLALKGAALALTVYPDAQLRVAGDLDLCVPDDQWQAANQRVAPFRSLLSFVDGQPSARTAYGFELDGTAHHDIDPPGFGGGRWRAGRLDWDGIWRRAVTADVDGHPLLVPEVTDLLITLVANSVRRGFSPLRLVVDIAELVDRRGAELDWERFGDDVRACRLDRRSWIPLALAAEWLGAAVPAGLTAPPPDLHPAWYERLMLASKRRRPFLRLPSRVLWAGSHAGAAKMALQLAATIPAERLRQQRSRARKSEHDG